MKSMEAIKTAIQALALTGVSSTNVLIQKIPRDSSSDVPAASQMPLILISPVGAESIDPTGGTNIRDQVVYPIQVLMLDRDDQSQTSNYDRYLLWRETIRQRFTNCRLSGVSEVVRVRVEASDILNPPAWTKGYFLGGLRIMVTSREERG